MRRNSFKKKAAFILALLMAALMAIVVIRLLPGTLERWKQIVFFGIFLFLGSVLELVIGKYVR